MEHVWRDKRKGGDLYTHLRSHFWGKRKRLRLMQMPVPGRRFINERPAAVQAAKSFGDWEIDTMKGKQGRYSPLTMVDRHSKYTIIKKLRTYKPSVVSGIIVKELSRFGSHGGSEQAKNLEIHT